MKIQSFKSMDQRIQLIVYKYRVLQTSVQEEDDELLMLEICISLLTEWEQLFFKKEYFENDPNWWLDYCSRATYYRWKRQIMKKFLDFYDLTM